MSKAAISRAAAGGSLHKVRYQTYAVGHRRLSRSGELSAAVLSIGGDATITGWAAAEQYRATRHPTRVIQVITSRRVRPRPGLQIIHCSAIHPDDATVIDGIPFATLARAALDLARFEDAHRVASVLHEGACWRRFDTAAFEAVLERAGHGPHHDRLCDAIELYNARSAGWKSELERAMAGLMRRRGITGWQLNVPVAMGDGAAPIEVDFLWSGAGLCLMVDGPPHERPLTKQQDVRDTARLRAKGLTVIRATKADIAGGAVEVMAAVERHLGAAAVR